MSWLALTGYGLLALAGLALSALHAGIEIGVYTLNPVRLAVRAGSGDSRAIRLRNELRHPMRLLSTLLIGINIATYFGSLGTAAILGALGVTAGNAVLIEVLILVPVMFILTETLPKDLFRTHTDRWSYHWSGFLTFSRRLYTAIGLVPLVEGIGRLAVRALGGDVDTAATARQRVSQLIKEGVGAGVLSEAQTTLIDRVLTMRARTVATEMVPWKYVVALRADAERSAHHSIMQQANFSRMPVIDRPEHVIGIVSTLDALLEADKPLTALLAPPLTFNASTHVREALHTMRARGAAMAIVLGPGESGESRAVGLVTIKDLVEPLIGDLAAW